ncbi:flavodoxin family protein [Thiovibrio sp. JS02]
MRIFAVNGSPRKKGNTEELLRAFLKGAESTGAVVEIVRLAELHIQPCIGCGGCDKTGECVLEDAMQDLYPKIRAANRIVLASPIYFYGITAQAKAFVDRCQALWNWKRIRMERGEWREDPGRAGFLLSVAASHGKRVFEGAILTARYAFDAMGVGYGGGFLVRGKDGRGEMAGDQATLARAAQAGIDFLACAGPYYDGISQETNNKD